jgi:hypothetical protein
MTHNEEVFAMVPEYAALNIHMFDLWGVNEDDLSCCCGTPNCPDAGKHPVGGRGVKDATLDIDLLRKRILEDPAKEPNPRKRNRNLGGAMGATSRKTALDIDIGEGKHGLETWAELIREHGEPETLRATTGGGGAHLIFQYNSALKTSSNTLGKHVDCRNDNGYIVLPPSLHRNGRRYQWDNWGTPCADLPAHLTKKKDTRGRPRKDDPLRQHYTLEQVAEMLAHIPADDRDFWRSAGIILGREFKLAEEAWNLYVKWSEKWEGQKGRGHDAIMHQAFYEISQQDAERELTLGTIIKLAVDGGWTPRKGDGSVDTFVYDHESNAYIYRPSGKSWVAASVDAACGQVNVDGRLIKASLWIQQHARITTTTSTPAIKGDILEGYDCREGVLFESPGGAVYNKYRPPTIVPGDAALAAPFEAHVRRLMPREGDADQFLNYLAHRVQKPEEKPRFALVIIGDQGVGKDTAIDFCCPAIGEWNVASIAPSAVEGGFNEYAAKTLIRINEAADLREMSRWAFNERIKVLVAGNPDACEINPKYGSKYTVTMHCGVVITSNHLTGSVHIPMDDRRFDVLLCATLEEMGLADDQVRHDYFTTLHEWYATKDGKRHIAAFLRERNLSGFSAALGQRKTAAHTEIVQHGMIGDEWAQDIVDGLGSPHLLRTDWLLERAVAAGEKKENVRARIGHALGRMGYDVLPNRHRKDGRWKIQGVLCKVYKRRDHKPVPEPDWQRALEIPDPGKDSYVYDGERNTYVVLKYQAPTPKPVAPRYREYLEK